MAAKRKTSWLFAALALIASSPAFASLAKPDAPRASAFNQRVVVFEEIESTTDAADDENVPLQRALASAIDASVPLQSLSETRVGTSDLFEQEVHQDQSPLTRALSRGSARVWPELTSDRTVLSPDPLDYRDSSNLYAFAGGDPVNGRDAQGKASVLSPSGNLTVSRRGGGVQRFTAVQARKDPTAVQAALDTDDETSYDESERIMRQMGLGIVQDAVCVPHGCVGPRTSTPTYKIHLPAGGRSDRFIGAILPPDYPPTTREMAIGYGAARIVQAVSTTGGVVAAGLISRTAIGLTARDESLLDARPWVRGYEVEDVRQGESYGTEEYVRSRPFQKEGDFTHLSGVERVEMKSLDVRAKKYTVDSVTSNGLRTTLNDYREQLEGYEKAKPTPFNILEIQLIHANDLTFAQDAVLRGFVSDSYNAGIIVEVHDYASGRVLIEPPRRK